MSTSRILQTRSESGAPRGWDAHGRPAGDRQGPGSLLALEEVRPVDPVFPIHAVPACVVLAVAVLLSGLYAYYVLFSSFAVYDDEGFLNISIRHFLAGWQLYVAEYTQYGPIYYVFDGD
jgi:hypothetical protein